MNKNPQPSPFFLIIFGAYLFIRYLSHLYCFINKLRMQTYLLKIFRIASFYHISWENSLLLCKRSLEFKGLKKSLSEINNNNKKECWILFQKGFWKVKNWIRVQMGLKWGLEINYKSPFHEKLWGFLGRGHMISCEGLLLHNWRRTVVIIGQVIHKMEQKTLTVDIFIVFLNLWP